MFSSSVTVLFVEVLTVWPGVEDTLFQGFKISEGHFNALDKHIRGLRVLL